MSHLNYEKIDIFEEFIASIPHGERKKFLEEKLEQLKKTKLNILVVGATGAGKSSTINAIFDMNIAKVGTSSTPETQDIKSFTLKNTVIWDTPGLGDSTENDRRFSKMIKSKLCEKDENGEGLIDLVLCILDGSSRDLGTTYTLLKNTIIPYLGAETSERLIVAINKADIAMSHRGWDIEKNEPEKKLKNFLEEKVESTRQRIKDDTGIDITPIYYAAGFKDEDEEQKPFNISKLLNKIITSIKSKKRAVLLRDVNQNASNFENDDKEKDYNADTQQKADKSWWEQWENIKDVVNWCVEFAESETGKKVIERVGATVKSFIEWVKKNKK
ncbi:GTPase [Otariodibacter sp.]|uniref:GTPase family protein n=1 Tax=Otariodibacter sp. TaxID=3030919 RepID=UPI00262E2DDF|nr:GTPase [Otariodibacter sp.]